MSSFKFNGREVQSPAARFAIGLALLVVTIAVIVGVIMFMAAIPFILLGVVLVAVVMIVLSAPAHFILKALGRRGFVERSDSDSFSYHISIDGFKRA